MKHPLRVWRETQNLTQQAAATMFGVTKQCWQKWESGENLPDRLHMRTLTKGTGVTADQLYARAAV